MEAGNIAAVTQKLQAAATMPLNLVEDELAETAERAVLNLKKAGTKELEYGTQSPTQSLK